MGEINFRRRLRHCSQQVTGEGMVTATLEPMPHISTLQETEDCRTLRLVDNLCFLIKLSGEKKTERTVPRSWEFPVLGSTLGKVVSDG